MDPVNCAGAIVKRCDFNDIRRHIELLLDDQELTRGLPGPPSAVVIVTERSTGRPLYI